MAIKSYLGVLNFNLKLPQLLIKCAHLWFHLRHIVRRARFEIVSLQIRHQEETATFDNFLSDLANEKRMIVHFHLIFSSLSLLYAIAFIIERTEY